MELQELIDLYGSQKAQANKLYSDYKNLMIIVEETRQLLQIKLQETGLKSAKSANFGVSIATKPSILVQSEQSVIEWLKNTPNIEYDQYIGLKLTPFKSLALEVLKQTGEIITGTELEMKDSLTIRKA